MSRRLLAAADTAEAEKSHSAEPPVARRRAIAVMSLVLLPVGAVALYLALGSPDMPGEPLAARQSAVNENRSVENMIAQVENHLASNPNDGRAWEILAPVYMRLNRFDEAVTAWRNVLRLNGSTAAHEADLGEALVFAADGVVTPDAKAQFDRAYAMEPGDVMARFYLGMASDQAGKRDEADAIWNKLLAEAPPGAPWVELVRNAKARKTAPVAAPAAPAPGPRAVETADAVKMPADHQDAAIAGMVARLADRLKKDGSDADGWVQLVRSYRALGDADKAQAAIADARNALVGAPDKLRRFAEGTEGATATPPALPPPPAVAQPAPNLPGPNAADIAAAQQLSGDQQTQMISGMVARLADRLKTNGSDVEGWLRLLRAYVVLGERDKAQAAAGEARRALAGEPDKIRRIDDMVKELGLQG